MKYFSFRWIMHYMCVRNRNHVYFLEIWPTQFSDIFLISSKIHNKMDGRRILLFSTCARELYACEIININTFLCPSTDILQIFVFKASDIQFTESEYLVISTVCLAKCWHYVPFMSFSNQFSWLRDYLSPSYLTNLLPISIIFRFMCE